MELQGIRQEENHWIFAVLDWINYNLDEHRQIQVFRQDGQRLRKHRLKEQPENDDEKFFKNLQPKFIFELKFSVFKLTKEFSGDMLTLFIV